MPLVIESASVAFSAVGKTGSRVISPASRVEWNLEKTKSYFGPVNDEFKVDVNVAFTIAIDGIRRAASIQFLRQFLQGRIY